MAINNGFIEGTINGTFVVRIYYDATAPMGNQPLINGPRGWCLDITNLSGGSKRVTVSGLTGNPQTFTVGQGDPVTTGGSRSRTAAEMAAAGFTTRDSVGNFQVS